MQNKKMMWHLFLWIPYLGVGNILVFHLDTFELLVLTVMVLFIVSIKELFSQLALLVYAQDLVSACVCIDNTLSYFIKVLQKKNI